MELLRRAHRVVLYGALSWAIANCLYVYLALDGRHSYRVESSLWVLVALLAPLAIWSRSPDNDERVELSRRQRRLIVAGAGLLWLWAMAPRLTLSFLSDDYVFLDLYRTPHDLLRTPEFFRPLFAAAFWLLAAVGRGSVVPFHAAALLLHAASTGLVYALCRRLLASPTLAPIASVAFLLNPLQLEATLWASGLQELVWTASLLGALWCYAKTRDLSPRMLAATAALLAAALLSKETAICFVVLIPAIDAAWFRFDRGPLTVRAYGVFAAIAAGYLIAHAAFAAPHPSFLVAPSRYFLQQLVGAPYGAFARPWNAVVCQMPPIVVAAIAVALIALLFVRVAMRGSPGRVFVGPAIVLASTLPVWSFFVVRADHMAGRYLYLAAAGWGILLAQLLTVMRSRVVVALAATSFVAASFACLDLNLEPWDVADATVGAMRAAIARGEPPRCAVERVAEGRSGFAWKDGVPESYRGVAIFRNGYASFVRGIAGATRGRRWDGRCG